MPQISNVEIARTLRAENERMRSALEKFANRDNWHDDEVAPISWQGNGKVPWLQAAEALTGRKD